jgi:uncharacterized protein (TIGR03067 family)
MRRHVLVALVVGLFVAADKPKNENLVKKEMKKLEGTWEVVTLQEAGDKVPAKKTKKMVMILAGDRLKIKITGEETHREYKFILNPSTEPKRIDLTLVGEPDVTEKDRRSWGIYLLKDDTLKVCLTRGKKRPTQFTPNEEVLMVLKRQKK